MAANLAEHCVCGPIGPRNNLVQYFRPQVDYLSGLAIKFHSRRKVLEHRVILRLYVTDESMDDEIDWTLEEKVPLYKEEICAAVLSDISRYCFYFPTLARSKGKLFAITVSTADSKDGETVTVSLSRGEQRIPGHVLCRAPNRCNGSYGMMAHLISSNPAVSSSFPNGLLYSPLSSCNMNCTHCISRHTRQRAVKMAAKIKHEIREKADRKQLRWIFTDYSGDIFFTERKNPGELDFLFSLGIPIHVDTNAACLDQKTIERVMASPIKRLKISVDAAKNDTYSRIRIGGPHIDHIFATARAVVIAREKFGRRDSLAIEMGFVMMRSNLDELPLFLHKAKEAGVDRVNCRHIEVYHEDMEAESLFGHKEHYNSIRATAIALSHQLGIELSIDGDLEDRPAGGGKGPCPHPWESAVVTANGDVMACCVPGSKMGSLNDSTLEEIWQGQVYRRLRERVNSHDPPSLCRVCPRFKSRNSYDSYVPFRTITAAKPLCDELMAETRDQSAEISGAAAALHESPIERQLA